MIIISNLPHIFFFEIKHNKVSVTITFCWHTFHLREKNFIGSFCSIFHHNNMQLPAVSRHNMQFTHKTALLSLSTSADQDCICYKNRYSSEKLCCA